MLVTSMTPLVDAEQGIGGASTRGLQWRLRVLVLVILMGVYCTLHG